MEWRGALLVEISISDCESGRIETFCMEKEVMSVLDSTVERRGSGGGIIFRRTVDVTRGWWESSCGLTLGGVGSMGRENGISLDAGLSVPTRGRIWLWGTVPLSGVEAVSGWREDAPKEMGEEVEAGGVAVDIKDVPSVDFRRGGDWGRDVSLSIPGQADEGEGRGEEVEVGASRLLSRFAK